MAEEVVISLLRMAGYVSSEVSYLRIVGKASVILSLVRVIIIITLLGLWWLAASVPYI